MGVGTLEPVESREHRGRPCRVGEDREVGRPARQRRGAHLQPAGLQHALKKRQNSVRAAGLDEMEDGRIVGEVRYRRQDHDE